LIAICVILAGVLIALQIEVHDGRSIATFAVSLLAFVLVCEHLVPMVIARHDPERVLDIVLPAFTPVARIIKPMTGTLLDLMDARRADTSNGGSTETETQQLTAEDPDGDEGEISDEEGRELLQSIVAFTESVVREVMTPRPDIIAIRQDASLGDLRSL